MEEESYRKEKRWIFNQNYIEFGKEIIHHVRINQSASITDWGQLKKDNIIHKR